MTILKFRFISKTQRKNNDPKKRKKAEKLGVRIISEIEFIDLLK
jgi:hypothetical protein